MHGLVPTMRPEVQSKSYNRCVSDRCCNALKPKTVSFLKPCPESFDSVSKTLDTDKSRDLGRSGRK